jgi:AbrB family looped-hinge helix DNA binding protein
MNKGRRLMDLVTVRNKVQIVIPPHVREQVHIEVGDILEADVEDGKTTFTPKSLVNGHLAEGLKDAKKSRTPRALWKRQGCNNRA